MTLRQRTVTCLTSTWTISALGSASFPGHADLSDAHALDPVGRPAGRKLGAFRGRRRQSYDDLVGKPAVVLDQRTRYCWVLFETVAKALRQVFDAIRQFGVG